MDTPEPRTRRNFPAETWAVVRDAYLGGETAPSIAKRLKLSENTIRKRATRCGWTHAAHARALAQAEETLVGAGAPATVAGLAPLARAAVLLEQGRAGEALTLIRAAEALNRATGQGGPAGSAAGLRAELEAAREELAAAKHELADLKRQSLNQLFDQTESHAAALARAMLSTHPAPTGWTSRACFHWRARVLGPAVARADFERAEAQGGDRETWWSDGRLRPLGRGQAAFKDALETMVAESWGET